MILNWYKITFDGVMGLWKAFMGFIPQLVGALVVFIIGWIIAVIIGNIVTEILRRLKFNQVFERDHLKRALERADIKVDPSQFIGGIFKWSLGIVFLLASVNILGFNQVTTFLQDVFVFLPKVLVSSLIFVVAVIVADIVGKILHATVEGAQMGSGHYVTLIVKWSIWIFTLIAILAILLPREVAQAILVPVVQGVIYFFVIGGGIAFGLGGKDAAAEFIGELKRKFKG